MGRETSDVVRATRFIFVCEPKQFSLLCLWCLRSVNLRKCEKVLGQLVNWAGNCLWMNRQHQRDACFLFHRLEITTHERREFYFAKLHCLVTLAPSEVTTSSSWHLFPSIMVKSLIYFGSFCLLFISCEGIISQFKQESFNNNVTTEQKEFANISISYLYNVTKKV